MSPLGSALKPRVTQTDIARVAGVHNTTVSLALRNCPSIPESTRQKIRAIADELGYYPDPTLQALVAYRKGRTPRQQREIIAYITNDPTRSGWRNVPALADSFAGAERKAAALGYQLEHFWLGEPGMTPRRLCSMLYHRNITGALLAVASDAFVDLSAIDWPRLSIVKIGSAPSFPELHRVTDDHSGMVRVAIRRALAAGYKRVGLVTSSWWDRATDQACSAGFLAEQRHMPENDRIPLLTLSNNRGTWSPEFAAERESADTTALGRWFDQHQPEVVLSFSPHVFRQLRQIDLSVPRDVGYIDLCLECFDGAVAGFRQNSDTTGEVAVATLVAQLQQNLVGVPAVATTTLVGATWIQGASLPAVRVTEPWSEDDKPCIDGLATTALSA